MKKVFLGLVIILGLICLVSCSEEDTIEPQVEISMSFRALEQPIECQSNGWWSVYCNYQVVISSDTDTTVRYKIEHPSDTLIPDVSGVIVETEGEHAVQAGENLLDIFSLVGTPDDIVVIHLDY